VGQKEKEKQPAGTRILIVVMDLGQLSIRFVNKVQSRYDESPECNVLNYAYVVYISSLSRNLDAIVTYNFSTMLTPRQILIAPSGLIWLLIMCFLWVSCVAVVYLRIRGRRRDLETTVKYEDILLGVAVASIS